MITTSKELFQVLVIPNVGSDLNVVKKVIFNIFTYDTDYIDDALRVKTPVTSILSDEDLASNNYISASSSTNQEIIEWAYNNVGGDEYYENNLKVFAESQLASILKFSDTVEYNFAI
jgi:hypothetical protein